MNSEELWKAIGDIEEDLILEPYEYSKSNNKKKTIIFFVMGALAASIAFFLVVSGVLTLFKNNSEGMQLSSSDNVIESDEKNKEKDFDIVVNYVDTVRSDYEEKGVLKEVVQEKWMEKYGSSIFLFGADLKYYFNYSEEEEVLYGIIQRKTKNGDMVNIQTKSADVAEYNYDELKKTIINENKVAVCMLKQTEKKENYFIIYQKSDVCYKIEDDNMTLDECKTLLQELFISK